YAVEFLILNYRLIIQRNWLHVYEYYKFFPSTLSLQFKNQCTCVALAVAVRFNGSHVSGNWV
ncbi:MAG: hypothetical protein AAF385_15905, partial [Pseudomonadota bacterium]